MKKTLLSILFCLPFFGMAQNIYNYGFSGTTANMTTAGWVRTNQSTPAGAGAWTIPTAVNAAFVGGGHSGGDTSFVLVNYTSTTGGTGTISNWLVSPVVNVKNGDIVTFYTRKGGTPTGTIYPDRLEFRMSTNGAASVLPSGGSAGLGDYTNLLLTVNPALTTTDYPYTFTQYSYTVSGLAGPTDCKFAFRYFVINGGPTGTNSDIIGVDDFSVDNPPLSVSDFSSKNFSIYPNPADNVLNLSVKSELTINSVQIVDLNGRVVKNVNTQGLSDTQINISDLTAGIYFVDVTSNQGKATSKFVKK